MKLSKELLLQAVNAAFEFNAENSDASAHVSFDKYSMTLELNVFSEENWAYYKISSQHSPVSDLHVDSHEENLKGFLLALKSHTSNN